MKAINRFRTFAATLLVLSICFFKWQPFGTPYANVTFLAFFLYFFASLLSFRRSFSLRFVKPYLLPAFAAWLIIFTSTMVNYVPGTENAFSQIRQFFMQLVFFWIFLNELIYNPKIRDRLLEVYLFSLAILSGLFLMGIGVEFRDARLAIMGVNANLLGFWYVLGVVILMRFILEGQVKGILKFFYILLLPAFLILMAMTGSRGAALTLLIGLGTYFLFIRQNFEGKVLILFLGLVAVAGISFALLQVDIMRERFLHQLDDGNLGHRLPIWEAVLDIFMNNPIFGTGTALYEVEIYQRINDYRVPHNEYLSYIVYGGVTAFVALLILLRNLLKSALRFNYRKNSPISLALMFSFLANFFVAGGLSYSFVTWFIFAYIAVSGAVVKRKKVQRHRELLVVRPVSA